MDDAFKAKIVWKAAFPRAETSPDEIAAELGEDLACAASLFAIASLKRPPREHRKLAAIEGASRKLLALCNEGSSAYTIARIEQFCTLELGWRNDLREILGNICAGAYEARRHNGGGEELRKAFGSSYGIFIATLGEVYFEFSRKRPGRCVSSDGDLGGPFLRFVTAAATQWDLPVPAPETVSRHLRLKHG
jgi:hypothetical protein